MASGIRLWRKQHGVEPRAEMPVSTAFREVRERRTPEIYPPLGYGCCWQPADASGFLAAHIRRAIYAAHRALVLGKPRGRWAQIDWAMFTTRGTSDFTEGACLDLALGL